MLWGREEMLRPARQPLHFLNFIRRPSQTRQQSEVHKTHIRCLINCFIILKTLINKLLSSGAAVAMERLTQDIFSNCLQLFYNYWFVWGRENLLISCRKLLLGNINLNYYTSDHSPAPSIKSEARSYLSSVIFTVSFTNMFHITQLD